MPLEVNDRSRRWDVVQTNPSYWPGTLSAKEGAGLRWHSPAEPRSSQVFCISAVCGLRALPDRDEILSHLFRPFLGTDRAAGPWALRPEYSRRDLLGETGAGTPTSVDVFCESPAAVVCVEGKLFYDAREGFGSCGQAKHGQCAGHYGPGSDRKTGTDAFCRLEVPEGRRGARRYWELAGDYFAETTFQKQAEGETCPFAGPSFQLMRNVLFAGASAGQGRGFAVVCLVPAVEKSVVEVQVTRFRTDLLRNEHRSAVGIRTYDELAVLLRASPHAESQQLGAFLLERLATRSSRCRSER
jgi:hypothetical protein